MRPTGQLHLGHLFGTLSQWVDPEQSRGAFYEVADLHAFTTKFAEPKLIRAMRTELVLDWLAAGVDPKRSTIFLQSGVPQISELFTLLSMIAPVGMLQRVPTYKDQIAALGPEIASYGFLGYPLLQLCDIAVFRAQNVPVGKDQLSHLEFGREIVRKFNGLYGDVLVEPRAILSEFPDVPGLDGRKMSKSYDNAIAIADDEQTTTKRIRSALTDPQKIRRHDPGRPEVCPVFKLHHLVNAERAPRIEETCRTGELGCVDCKTELAEAVNTKLRPMRERRSALIDAPDHLEAILADGTERAREVAEGTMKDVRRSMELTNVVSTGV